MQLRRAAVLASIMLVAGTIPAFADPISAAIVTALALEGTAAVVATIVIDVAISVALSAVATLLTGGRKGAALAAENPFGLQSTLQSGGTVSRAWGFGFYSTAGSEIYPARTWGDSGKTPNAYFTRFIALSDLPVESLSSIIVDDQRCTYGDGTPDANLGYAIPEYATSDGDHLWVKFYDGTQTDADAWAVSQFAGDPDYPYGTDQVGVGIAYVIVTALIDQTLFSSFPQYKFELQGAKLYDPRADDTVGGDGDQRWSDASTWDYTENPSVVKYNVLRGISLDGQWLYGLQGTSAGRLPLDSWFAAMNACDTTIETKPGVEEPQYRCGGEVVVSSQPSDLLDELNKCDNGHIAEAGGIFKTRSGAVSSSVMSFSDADLIVTEAKSFNPFPGLETTINGIAATYPDPNQNWVMTDAPALYNSILEAEDGGRRLISAIEYNFVPFQSQVQRLMQSSRDEARKFRKHVVVAPPYAFALEALDVISWTSEENGYTDKLFTVVPTDQDNLDQGLALVEVDPADYDWDPSTDYRTYTPVSIVTRAPPSQTMTGWSVSGETITGDDGRSKAGIRFTWGTSGISDVNGVLYQVRLASDSSLTLAGETDHFAEGTLVVSQNLSSDTDYEARGKYRPASANRETDWSSWLSVTTPDVKIPAIDIEDASLTALKFASGIEPVQVVSSLASADAHEGAQAVLTTTGKLYRYHSGVWTNAVDGADISDYTVLPSKIFIGSSDNLILDGACIDPSAWASFPNLFPTTPFVTGGVGGIWINDSLVQWSPNAGGGTGIVSPKVACVPGDEFFLSARIGDFGFGSNMWLTAVPYDSSGSPLTTIHLQQVPNAVGGPYLVAGSCTIPSGAAFVSFGVYSTNTGGGGFSVSTPAMRRRMTGSLIVNGAIAAQHMSADSVTAGAVAAGAINATAIIATDVVVTGHLVSNAITSPSVASGSSHAISSGGGYDTLASISKTLTGTGDVLVQFTDYLTWSVNGPRGFYRIIDDASNVILSNGYGGGSCPDFITSTGSGLDTNGRSGSVTYYLQANWAAGANQPTSQSPVLVVTELKK